MRSREERAKILAVDRPPHRPAAIVGIVLFLPAFFLGWRAIQELSFRYTAWNYSREFAPGMKRKYIEDQLFFDGRRFRQRFTTDVIGLGEVGYSLRCAPTEVYLTLEFAMENPLLPTDVDALREIRLIRQPGDCR